MFNVSVSEKKPNHSTYNQGSKMAYTINGKEDETLRLVRGRTYTFMVNAPNHPFYFTSSPIGGPKDTNSLMGPNEPVTDQGVMSFTVRSDLPDTFYYQCKNHPQMGNKVIIDRVIVDRVIVDTVRSDLCNYLLY